MQKNKLIVNAEYLLKEASNMSQDSPRKERKQVIADLVNAIIRAICEVENLTPHIAKVALKTAEEIIESVIENDVIL